MRAGALSDGKVGEYLKKNYVSAWKRVGTFTAIRRGDKTVARAGGNVAVYFCTPDLEVVHAIAGPVGKKKFLEEARWAADTYRKAAQQAGGDRASLAKLIEAAHRKASPNPARLQGLLTSRTELGQLTRVLTFVNGKAVENGNGFLYTVKPDSGKTVTRVATLAIALGAGRNMHSFLAGRGLPKLDSVYKHVFQRILGEQVTDTPVRTTDLIHRNWGRQLTHLHALAPARASAPDEGLRAQVRSLQQTVKKLQEKIEKIQSQREY